ncbi:MAG: lactate utilization protein [Candidatus Paceibacterota bacterium]
MNYKNIHDNDSIEKTLSSLNKNNFIAIEVKTREEALAKIMDLIPKGASVMNGASETLREIGYMDILKGGTHGWNNLHDAILAEKDPGKQSELRRRSVVSDYYVGSAHAVTEDGQILFASNTGSQLSHLVYTSPNIILVIGAQKIVANITEAFDRLEKHIIPLEDERMKKVYGYGTSHTKTVILHKENPALGRKVNVIIVKEALGF